jgi:ubiquinone/menaquinone biosynthesis C-methylase UbiE
MNIVEAHYAQPGLVERVREALRESGMNPDALDQAELGKRDQFHVGGAEATGQMARLLAIQATDRVLDMGSGIGGPSRYLASTIGCHVTGLDLTDEYCQVATMLARSTGLSHLVDFQKGDAIRAPFGDQRFDVILTQHASMNIEDKRGLYREMSRLLKPGGRLGIHDIVSGEGEVRYPVPWARRSDFSFLISEQDMNAALTEVGFRKTASEDVTAKGLEALRMVAKMAALPGFGLRTLMGPEFPTMAANLIVSLQSGACLVIQAAYTK